MNKYVVLLGFLSLLALGAIAVAGVNESDQNNGSTETKANDISDAGLENFINSGSGNDRLNGTDKNDRIRAGWGNDILNGRYGSDVLSGELGKDIFVFDIKTAFSDIDTITDFDTSFDYIDISDILGNSGYMHLVHDISGYVQITNEGKDIVLSIDREGSGKKYEKIVRLKGVSELPKIDDLVTNDTLIVTKAQRKRIDEKLAEIFGRN